MTKIHKCNINKAHHCTRLVPKSINKLHHIHSPSVYFIIKSISALHHENNWVQKGGLSLRLSFIIQWITLPEYYRPKATTQQIFIGTISFGLFIRDKSVYIYIQEYIKLLCDNVDCIINKTELDCTTRDTFTHM